MSIAIRKAETGDFAAIFSLISEFALFIQTPGKVTTTEKQMIEDKELFSCLVAIKDGAIVGFASYFLAYYSWTGKALYLDDLYVRENCRGQGIGNKLFDEVVNIARETKCRKLKWQVSKWNQAAIGFYKSKGAVIDDVEINCDLVLQD
jgi:ribosomal protein S18 acetylase RimI-like enzyme